MTAPKLLDKKLINAEVATQKAQTIRQGLDLAKKVDILRETLQDEQGRLEAFRQETIATVQRDIDVKIAERDALERGNIKLREERILAQAPIDLVTEWQQVRENKAINDSWHERLMEHQITQVAKDAELSDLSMSLGKKREEIAEVGNVAQRNLSEAEVKFTQASDILERAKKDSEQMLADAREIENRLNVREEDATNREIYLSKREEEVQVHEVDLARREQKLRRNQETFIRAQNYLNNRK